ncbi:DUF4625 domain-containing protein [Pseudobacter ginsenosidimutans]|uniref:Uncharacterized protein DUF4625 n=1 Tax=Pseudobacter ginsenosidimutans TaxID=661488 RepID=A0A4Q7MYX1_9BACT|nr:DUF4625 domain-containing protein [Pseudobacter ginsenosidimutans]QEC43085.1 DUF4625 domain-containing protein [Pseudobacter ginsenosidimutans]RZS74440.1 uncharacterized protein DUF4625 [Pseudobacter ginsenosidimutans]
MKLIKYAGALCLICATVLSGCSKDEKTVDTEYPVIDLSAASSFPKQCSELKRGETFNFKALLKDNAKLGSFSLDIHHNFDHHSHSTEVNSCNMDPVKAPVNPMLYIRSFPIPDGRNSFEADVEIAVPSDIDPGDYHFMILLTDAEGWQTIKGLSIKIK